MYAVFRAGGKQYRATEGQRLKLEKFEAEEGADVSFDEVLLIGEGADVKLGNPLLAGTTVSARVLRQGRGGKVGVTKFKRRVNYLRQHTHRQWYTEVEITSIGGAPKKAQPKPEAAEAEPAAPAGTEEVAEAKAAAGTKSKKKVTKKKVATQSASGKKTAKKTAKKAKKKADD